MQQEDDLRALAKIMEFGRAVSIFLLVVHVYVYCYPSITAWHLNLEVIDRILINFNNTTGIFNCILWSKLSAVLLLAVSCLGTHGVKGEKITWPKIYAVLVAGCALFFLNWWLLKLPLPHMANTAFYIFTLTAGYLALLMSGLWMSRIYRHNLMEDVFNMENESFMHKPESLQAKSWLSANCANWHCRNTHPPYISVYSLPPLTPHPSRTRYGLCGAVKHDPWYNVSYLL